MSVKDAARAKFPLFTFGHNVGAKATQPASLGMWLHYQTNLFDYVHWEEYGHSLAPYCQLPTYLLGVAAGKGDAEVTFSDFVVDVLGFRSYLPTRP